VCRDENFGVSGLAAPFPSLLVVGILSSLSSSISLGCVVSGFGFRGLLGLWKLTLPGVSIFGPVNGSILVALSCVPDIVYCRLSLMISWIVPGAVEVVGVVGVVISITGLSSRIALLFIAANCLLVKVLSRPKVLSSCEEVRVSSSGPKGLSSMCCG